MLLSFIIKVFSSIDVHRVGSVDVVQYVIVNGALVSETELCITRFISRITASVSGSNAITGSTFETTETFWSYSNLSFLNV